MPRAGGVYTLPAGNPVVTLTVISSAWGNTTMSDIATALTGSLPVDGSAPMTSPLRLADGAVGTPGLTWATETTSGWYRIGANDFGFSVATVKKLEVTANGLSVFGAGSSTTNPLVISTPTGNYGLRISPTLNTQLPGIIITDLAVARQLELLFVGSGSGAVYGAAAGTAVINAFNALTLSTNDSARLVIANAGNVVINAPTSGSTLVLGRVASASPILVVGDNNSQMSPVLSVRSVSGTGAAIGNQIEFGHSNAAGFGCSIGAQSSSGSPFIAFSAEAGTNINTYKTRGIAGSVLQTDAAGAFSINRITNVNADNQAPTAIISTSVNGNVTIAAPSSGTALTVGTSTNAVTNATVGLLSIGVGQSFASNTAEVWGTGGVALNIGTTTATAFGLWSNDIQRVGIGSAGNVTINAPTSGVALTVSAVAGANALTLNANAGAAVGINGNGIFDVVSISQGTGSSAAIAASASANSNVYLRWAGGAFTGLIFLATNGTGMIGTGAAAPVLTANKPTGGGTAIQTWLSVTISGTPGFIPVWQ